MCADAYDAEPAREPSPTPAPRLVVLICHSTLLATSHVCPSSSILCLSMGSGQCTAATVAGFFLFAAGRHSFVLCVNSSSFADDNCRAKREDMSPRYIIRVFGAEILNARFKRKYGMRQKAEGVVCTENL
jgi:hypothetical protein